MQEPEPSPPRKRLSDMTLTPEQAALLASYLAARAHHAEAGRQVLRAERTAGKLTRRAGGSDKAWARACTVAGVDLADHRSLAAAAT